MPTLEFTITPTVVQTVDEAVRAEAATHVIDRDGVAKLEASVGTLGEYPGLLGEMVQGFYRAVAMLKMRHHYGDDDSITLASAHVQEVWENLSPALERFAAAGARASGVEAHSEDGGRMG